MLRTQSAASVVVDHVDGHPGGGGDQFRSALLGGIHGPLDVNDVVSSSQPSSVHPLSLSWVSYYLITWPSVAALAVGISSSC